MNKLTHIVVFTMIVAAGANDDDPFFETVWRKSPYAFMRSSKGCALSIA